ncbi:MAG: hypothetical protein MI920_15930 [Kiloniellales bacterium]|nr:hypothetical protein [Kiloniellales bacterium]
MTDITISGSIHSTLAPDQANAESARRQAQRWSPRQSFLFTVGASAALWALITLSVWALI